jgi:transcriptional regulator with XRE-family HTH domain
VANRKGNGRQRQLGRRLRRMREDAGLTIDAAEKLEFSASKLGRIETAEQGVDVHVVRSMLDLYDVGGDRWTETVLRNAFGDPPMMRAQLAHLLATAELPTVTLQVLPADSKAHESLASGFTVLSFGALGEPDLAYVEHALGAAFLEGEDDVRLARNQFDRLRTLALTPAASLALLREIAAAL